MDVYQKTADFFGRVPTEKRVVGKSLFGRNIYAVKLGNGRPTGIAQYAIHGREFITAELAVLHYEIGVAAGSLWLVPLVNPDGALLSECGLSSLPTERKEAFLRAFAADDFSLWKANGRGVDLNVNFPARWGTGARNVRKAGAENYVGEYPLSESESRALAAFTLEIRPDYTVSYHTKGEEIYWYFHQSSHTCLRDRRLAEALFVSTGYPLAYARDSVGGYKDWCIQTLGIPAFTIEAGADEFTHPLGEAELSAIARNNRFALYDLSKEVKNLL